MKSIRKLRKISKRFISTFLSSLLLLGLLPAFEARTLAADVQPRALGAGEIIVIDAAGLKAALENSSVTTIYLGANINLRTYGLSGTNNLNSSAASNAYTNSTYLMNTAVRSDKQVTLVGTDPTTGNRYTFTDRRTNDRGAIPLVLPNTAMTFTFKDIDIYGYNYYGLLNGSDGIAYNIVFDGVHGITSQYLHLDASTVTVRNSVLKTRDTGLRTSEEFFECGNVILEGNTVFDDQSTDNTTMFYVKNSSNRSLKIADNANVTLIERGLNSYGILYPSGNSLIIGEDAKLTSVLAEPEGAKGNANNNTDITYTTGYNYGSSTLTASQSYFTFSGSEAHASVVVGARSELTIIHPFDTTLQSYDILHTTTSAGITVNEGGILSVYSKDNSSRVLDTSMLTLNNPRMVTLYTEPSLNLFSGTIPLKATKLKSIRYYSTIDGSYTFPANEAALTGTSGLGTYAPGTGTYNANRVNPTTWFFQMNNSFDVTSANINGTGTVNNTTYSGTTAVTGVSTSLTSATLNASQMRVVQIDGDYSRRPVITQAEADATTITGTGVPGAKVNLYNPSGTLVGSVTVDSSGNWSVGGLPPLVAKTVYSATQQANIAGYYSSPSSQVTMTVRAKAFRLIATNNTAKTYMTGYINAGFNNVGGASDYVINELKVIIFNNPDENIAAKSNFSNEYANIGSNGIAYTVTGSSIPKSAGIDDYMSVGRLIQHNCAVWAQASITANNTTVTLYDTVRYKNIFTPYTVWLRAVIKDKTPIDRLFDYLVVNPISPASQYGIPYMGDGTSIYGSPIGGFDSVSLTAASTDLAHKYDLVDHWTATVGATSYGTPYPLQLGSTFGTNPSLYDGIDPSKYTLNYVHKADTWWENAPVVFVDSSGNILSVGAVGTDIISIPLKIDSSNNAILNTSANNNEAGDARLSFQMLGGRYTPPSESNRSPVGWYVSTAPVPGNGYNRLTDFTSDAFNPIFGSASDKLYIVYDTGMFQVAEEYYEGATKIDTDKSQYYATNDSGNYKINPKPIAGYVPTGWEINAGNQYTFTYNTGMGLPTANQYDLFPENIKSIVSLFGLASNNKVTIKFYYSKDTRHNGIPDSDEGQITYRWRGTTVNGSAWPIQPFQTIFGRKGFTIKVPNSYLDADYPSNDALDQDGISDHKIKNTIIPQQPATANWVFDEIAANAAKTGTFKVTPVETDDVFFDYAFSTDGTNKDKDQFVTERYYLINNTDTDTGSQLSGWDETKTYILKGSTYSKAPPTIPGYIYVGYRWDSASGSGNQIVYQNGLAPLPVTKPMSNLTHTVTFLYRAAATGSVSVSWSGKTYGGKDVPFGTVYKQGYLGEPITVSSDEISISSGWNFTGGYIGAAGGTANTTHQLPFTLDNTAQTGVFMYKEAYDEVTVNAIYKSDDNSLNFTQAFPPTLSSSTEMVSVSPFVLNGYVLNGWVVNDSFGNIIKESDTNTDLSKPVSVNPQQGSQTVVFSYRSTLTSLYIRCYDESGKEIAGTAQKISNVNIGETFYANAPIVEVSGDKYALRSDEPLIKSANITSGTNTIIFNYVKITNSAYIILKEDASTSITGAETVFGYRIHTFSNGQTVPAPDLSSDYYTFADTNNKTYDGSNPITYKYKKNLKNVYIQPIDENGANIGTAKTLTNAGRIGEMYEAVCDIKLTGYTLMDTIKKNVYVDQNVSPITVKFSYKQDEIGDVKVISYYGGLGNADNLAYRLGEYTIKGIVGGKMIINAEAFTGFSVNGVNVQEITVGASNTTVYFQYNDDRKIVTVKHYKSNGSGGWVLFTEPEITDATINVLNGENAAVTARTISNYVLTGYTIDSVPPGGGVTPVSLGSSLITIPSVSANRTVYLCYTETSAAVSDQLVPVTIRGLSGGTVLYEYTVNRVKNSGNYTASAQTVFGYELASSELSFKTVAVTDSASPNPVIFQYDSLTVDVTIRAVIKSTTTPVTGFAEFTVPAVKNAPFSYNAPYIPGWNLDGSPITMKINAVSDADKTLTFQYTQASGNVLVILKENDTNGRIIKTMSAEVNAGNTPLTIGIPNLTTEFYTVVGGQNAVSVVNDGTAKTIEYYYTKDTRTVKTERYNTATGSSIDTVTSGSYRIGEVSAFAAPAPPAGLMLTGDVQKLVLIASMSEDNNQTVRFNYNSTQTTDLVVNAIENGTNNLLYTYKLVGIQSSTVNVPAPFVPGYILKSDELAGKTGTFGGSAVEFKYVQNTSLVTVKLVDNKGGDISYLASAGFKTSFDVEKGKSYTVIAPNLTGYVLAGGQAGQITLSASDTNADQDVTFVYRTVNELYVTHTIIGKDLGTSTELYKYSFSVLRGDSSSTYTAAFIPDYNCVENVKTLPNSDNGVIQFSYTIAADKVNVIAKDESDNTLLTVTYTNGNRTQAYVVRAPYVETGGKVYALEADEELYKSVDWSTSNEVMYTYAEVAANEVLLELREKDGDIIKLIEVKGTDSYTLSDIQALLEDDKGYYTYHSTAETTFPITKDSGQGMHTFYYTKDPRDIVVIAKAGSVEIGRSIVSGVGRAGEMYTAVARSILGYALSDQPSQTVYVDPTKAATEIVFQYVQLAASDVKVTAYYKDKLIEHTLFEYTVAGGVAGSVIEFDVPQGIDGWTLKPGQTNPRTHTITGVAANDSLKFEYVMKTVSVTTKFVDESGASISPDVVKTVQADLSMTLSPPLLDGYAFVRSSPSYADRIYNNGQILTFTYRRTSSQAAVMFMFLDTNGKQLDSKYVNGAIDSEIGILSVTPSPDLSGYTLSEAVLSDGTTTTTYTNNFSSIKVTHGLHKTVTLTYAYMGVIIPPTGGGSAKVVPAQPMPGDTVTVVITPEDGYELAGLTIKKSDDGTIVPYTPNPPILGADGTYTVTYTQPDGEVIVDPQFRAKGTGDSPVVINPTDNGSVTVDPRNPQEGETVTLTLTPDHGYDLYSLSITNNETGLPITYDPNPLQANPDGSYTVTYTQPAGGATVNAIYKEIDQFSSSVEVAATENGSVTVNPSDPASGSLVTLILTPNTGYDLSSLSIKDGNGADFSFTGPEYQHNGTYKVTYIQPASGATVNAQFAPSVLIRNTTSGTVSASTYNPWPLETVTITITPKPGCIPTAVKVTGVHAALATPLLSAAKTTATLTPVYNAADGTYKVTFVQPFYGAVIETVFTGTADADITVIDPPANEGTIDVSPQQPKPGQEITLTITPKTTYDLKTVSIAGSNGQIPYTITDNGNIDRTYTVTYIQPDDAVTISADFIRSIQYTAYSDGTVTTNTTDPWPGDIVVITATPDHGFDLSTLQIKDVNNKTVSAIFTANPDGTYTIVYTQPMGGVTIDPVFVTWTAPSLITVIADNGAVRYLPTTPKANETVTVYTTPDYGYVFSSLTIVTAGGGTVITTPGMEDGTFTYTQPSEDITITAEFLPYHFSMNIENGRVILDPATPQPGKLVSLLVTPSQGYMLDTVNPSSWLKFYRDAAHTQEITVSDLVIIGNKVTLTWPAGELDMELDAIFPDDPGASGKVTIKSTGSGIISVDSIDPDDGQKVIITATPGFGYRIDTVRAIDMNGNPITIHDISDGVYSYTHPTGSTSDTVTVVFTMLSMNITVTQTQGGTILVPQYARPGESVTVTVTPEPTFTAKFLKVDGEIVALTYNNKGGYTATYTQPTLGSQIIASFVPSIDYDFNRTEGLVEIENLDPLPLSTVYVKITPFSGNVLDSLFINGTEVKYTLMSNGQYLAEYKQPLAGGSFVSVTFKPSVAAQSTVVTLASNGRIDVTKSTGLTLNDPVEFTVTPDSGYKLAGISVVDKNGGTVSYSGSPGYTYRQPASGSIIYAQFVSTNSGNSGGGSTVIIIDNSKPVTPPVIPPEEVPPDEPTPPPPVNHDSDVSALLNTDDHMAYVAGSGDGYFSPYDNMTRAEVAQIFYNLLREKNVPITRTFTDVPDDVWYANAVNTLASMGIINGLPDGLFHPELWISRAEFATLVVKFAKISPGGMVFNDVPADHWAYNYINTAANFGWVTGVGEGNFAPERKITRAEAVVLMNKVLRRYCDKAAIDSRTDLKRFYDVKTDHWAYYHIIEASNAHNYELDSVTETWVVEEPQ